MPDGVWYFVSSKQNTNTRHGYWKAKGEAIEVFSNSVIIGWRISHEFYEGQVSHEHKTDWVMQEFSITRKRVCESTKSENSSSLCRVFLSAEQTPNSENKQNISTDDDAKTELAFLERKANNHVPYLPDSDYISRGDLLELLDLLDEPASPSSSSETSSCVTMSSDNFFDPDAWLKELETNNNQDEVLD
ncbi:hypothetical protein LWI29_015634 [Acer saccharum]|uniref:NAC domain-containing protein n=1 Tax=Acer saccharum TaxID=4024 RepID=A0AA39RM88_ACESA|nr:hypothetical protein LWI29_015634 [Acer saccharum]